MSKFTSPARPRKKVSAVPKLKEMREEKGWSQARLAKEAGLRSSMTVTRLEAGFTENPRLANVVKIALVLGVAVEDLL